MSLAEEAIANLRAKEASMRCGELIALLERLGFIVTIGRSGKHRTIEHPGIPSLASNFDGGHGKDAEIKSCYTREMRKLIDRHKEQLSDWLEQ